MPPIRIGFVGLSAAGWASFAHAGPLAQLPELYSITAVSTSSAESAKASADKHGAKKAYHGDTRAIAEDPDVDLVAVSVRTQAHRDAVLPAIAAHKDLFVEWPLGSSLQETAELADAARRAGVRSIIGIQGWQSPMVTQVREWIAAGKIGRVLSASWLGSKPVSAPLWGPVTAQGNVYTLDPANGVTVVSIVIGHNLSVVTRMLGPLASVSAASAHMFPTVQIAGADATPTDATMPNPAADTWAFSGPLREHGGALFTGSWRHGVPVDGRPAFSLLIDGDKGYIKVEGSGENDYVPHVVTPARIVLNGEEHKLEEGSGNVHRAWEAFARGEPGSWPTFDDAVDLHKHLDAIERSAKEGRSIAVDV